MYLNPKILQIGDRMADQYIQINSYTVKIESFNEP